jgi:hypothetical protein
MNHHLRPHVGLMSAPGGAVLQYVAALFIQSDIGSFVAIIAA